MLAKKGSAWCVLHGPDSKEKEGTVIKCYSFKRFGKLGAYSRAKKVHAAIILNKKSN